jgi:hypothetical protein
MEHEEPEVMEWEKPEVVVLADNDETYGDCFESGSAF